MASLSDLEFSRDFRDPAWSDVARAMLAEAGIRASILTRAEQGENIVFMIGRELVLKIYRPDKEGFSRELTGLHAAAGRTGLAIPSVVRHGRLRGYQYLITEQLPGRVMTRAEWLTMAAPAQVRLVRQLANELRDLHQADASEVTFDWKRFLEAQIESAVEKQIREGGNPEWLRSMPGYLAEHLPLLRDLETDVFMHGDVHFGNLRVVAGRDGARIVGIFDFADSLKGPREYEFIAVGVLMLQGQGKLQREFFRTYGYPDSDVNEELRHCMFVLTMMYEHSSLRRCAERLGVDPLNYKLRDLGKAIWSFA